MPIQNILAEILGSVFVLVGASVLNKRYIKEVFRELGANIALTWIAGFVTFVMGITFVALYNVWNSDWTIIITIVGWLMVIKGAYLTLFPKSSIKTYRHIASDSAMVVVAIIAIVIGVTLLYFGLSAVGIGAAQSTPMMYY